MAVPGNRVSHESGELNDLQAILGRCIQMAWVHQFKGSAQLQEEVLAAIDLCLDQGKISQHGAVDYRAKVNRICAEETWYLSNGERTIPDMMIDQDTKELTVQDGQLKKDLIGNKPITEYTI
jgi:hypothetical protein